MKLPIQGAGLDAIIRGAPTTPPAVDSPAVEEAHQELARKAQAAEEALNRQRQECDKAVAELREELTSLRKGADKAVANEREAQKTLQTENARLQKIINDDYPTGAARRLMVDSLFARAEEFENDDENLLDAFHLYRRIIRLDPSHIPALYAIATLYYSVDIEEKAVEVLEAIVELAPHEQRARETLATLRGDDT